MKLLFLAIFAVTLAIGQRIDHRPRSGRTGYGSSSVSRVNTRGVNVYRHQGSRTNSANNRVRSEPRAPARRPTYNRPLAARTTRRPAYRAPVRRTSSARRRPVPRANVNTLSRSSASIPKPWTEEDIVYEDPATISSRFECYAPGFYANPDDCRTFHRCVTTELADGTQEFQRLNFFCKHGTVFDQFALNCGHESMSVPCQQAEDFHYINDRVYEAPRDDKTPWAQLHNQEDYEKLEKLHNIVRY